MKGDKQFQEMWVQWKLWEDDSLEMVGLIPSALYVSLQFTGNFQKVDFGPKNDPFTSF